MKVYEFLAEHLEDYEAETYEYPCDCTTHYGNLAEVYTIRQLADFANCELDESGEFDFEDRHYTLKVNIVGQVTLTSRYRVLCLK